MAYIPDMCVMVKRLAILTIFIVVSSCPAQPPLKPLVFSAEDDKVTDFVQLPDSVLTLLLDDKEDFPDPSPSNVHCEDHEHYDHLSSDEDRMRPQILCRKLPLSSQPGENYLVIGVGGLRGAHIVPFWIFHRDEHGASLLFKTYSDQIEIAPYRFHGYALVRSRWVHAAGATIETESFRFDGQKYERYSSKTLHQ